MASTDPAPLQGLELHKPAASVASGRLAHLVVLAIATMGTGGAIRRSAHLVVLAMGTASVASGEAGQLLVLPMGRAALRAGMPPQLLVLAIAAGVASGGGRRSC